MTGGSGRMSGWMARAAILAGVGLILGGCASGGGWHQAGSSPADVAQATAACTRDMPVKVYGYESRVRIYRVRDVDPACMRSKGFTGP